jgi:two-component system nitrate/nitrite response regulator NarL
MLEGICHILEKNGFTICFSAKTLEEIIEEDHGAEPELVLAALASGSIQDCLEQVQDIKDRLPQVKFVFLVESVADEEPVLSCPLIDGLILRTVEAKVLTKALEVVLLGERVVSGMGRPSPDVAAHLRPLAKAGGALHLLQPAAPEQRLSPRELEVLRQLSCGNSNKLIARQIGVSEATVKAHMKAILRKLRARNRTEAAVWARSNGIAINGHAGSA